MNGSSGGHNARPSRIAERILRRLARGKSSGPYVVGDLREEYRLIVPRRGRLVADAWYWSQVIGIGGRLAAQRSSLSEGEMMGSVRQDLRFALRSLRRRPLFTAIVVGALGLGIAGATMMFSVVDGVLIKDLPYEDPETLVSAWKVVPEWRGVEGLEYIWDHMPFSWAETRNIRENSRLLSEVAAYRTTETALGGGGIPGSEKVSVGYASANLFPLLGVRPLLGRSFSEEEAPATGAGAAAVVILSHQLWSRRFGSDRSVLGRTVDLNASPHTVIGVLPPDFRLSSDGWATFYTRGGVDEGLRDIWVPLIEGSGNELLARLNVSASVEQARAEIQSLMGQETPGQGSGGRFARVAKRKDFVTRGFGPPLLLLLGAAATLLLVVCVSVAGLLIAEGAGRLREIALRSALGAGRWRVIRLLLTESAVLGALGASMGVVLAWLGTDIMLSMAPPIPRVEEVGIDLSVLLFAVAVGVGAGALAGLVPAVSIVNPSIAKSLGGRGQTSGRESQSLQHRVLTVQVALTVLLLVAGGLFARSVYRLMSVEPGFDPERLIVMDAMLPPPREDVRSDYARLWGEVLRTAESAPGIESVTVSTFVPFGGLSGNDYFTFQRGGERVDVSIAASRRVWPNYHETMGIPLIEGRYIAESEGTDDPVEMLVSASLAERIWPDASPVGTIVSYHGVQMTVVGVVEDVRKKDLGSPPDPVFYFPVDRLPTIDLKLAARYAGDRSRAAATLREAILSVHTDMALSPAQTMISLMRKSEADDRFRALLVATFAALATLMAGLGIFGVTARGVAARAREMGVRKALGATDSGLVGFVIRGNIRSGLMGGTLGLVASLGVSRLLSHFLYGVESYDPVTYLGVAALLVLVCVSAAYLPARRVTRMAPMEVIGQE